MQIILSGHVPPASYYPQCFDRLAEITLAYQDIIIASIYGHANADHFTLFEHEEDKSKKRKHKHKAFGSSSLYDILSAADLPQNLQDVYSSLPKHPNPDNFAFNHIAPSVIPTYQPAFRIWTYNTSISDGAIYDPESESTTLLLTSAEEEEDEEEEDWEVSEIDQTNPSDLLPTAYIQEPMLFTLNDSFQALRHKRRKSKHRRKKKKQPTYDRIPRHVSPHSPSRSNRFGTLLGYVQYYLPLNQVNAHHGWGANPTNASIRPFPEFEVEYTTYTSESLQELIKTWPNSESLKGKNEDLTAYGMSDLTIGSWLDLTSRLSKGGNVWKGYVKRMFVQTR